MTITVTNRINDFCNKELPNDQFQLKYGLKENYQWKVDEQRKLVPEFDESYIDKISYRPFDKRIIYFQDNLVFRMRNEVMSNLRKPNIAFCCVKLGRNVDAHNYFVTDEITDKSITSSLDNANVFPLYLYPETGRQQELESSEERRPNLDMEIVDHFTSSLGLEFTPEKEERNGTLAPIDILDYIYAVLHSPSYREKYKESLKIDFPRVPYLDDPDKFWSLVTLGCDLRQIHLLESRKLEQYISSYPNDGDNTITRKIVKKDWELYDTDNSLGRIWVNDEQYFDQIPLAAWEFFLGGYQPAQKWLKDRHGRTLSYADILHYQKIIVALTETDSLMKEIDKIEI